MINVTCIIIFIIIIIATGSSKVSDNFPKYVHDTKSNSAAQV